MYNPFNAPRSPDGVGGYVGAAAVDALVGLLAAGACVLTTAAVVGSVVGGSVGGTTAVAVGGGGCVGITGVGTAVKGGAVGAGGSGVGTTTVGSGAGVAVGAGELHATTNPKPSNPITNKLRDEAKTKRVKALFMRFPPKKCVTGYQNPQP